MMNMTRVTDALPVVGCSVLSPVDFADVDYSPALVLPTPFGVNITRDKEYQAGCEDGFTSYFETVCYEDDDCLYHSRQVVKSFIIREALPTPDVFDGSILPLPYRIGFVVGWLSALALTNKPLALEGLDMLAFVAANVVR